MVSLYYLLVAAASLAGAASNCSSNVDASDQSDLDAISDCDNFKADINIKNSDASVLTLNGVKNITGSITINNCTNLGSFSAPSLQKVSKYLDLSELTVLDTLSMPQLTDLGGIKLVTLPNLEELQFNTGVQNAKDIFISDTQLKSLEGLNLSTVNNFNINNNKNIDEIEVGATQIAGSLDIAYNAAKVNVSLPNLKWANNATFRYCSSVDIPQLEKINSTLAFVNNTLYGLDFPDLKSVGSLTINSNSELRNASFASLKEINGGFSVANNSHFGKVYGFPKLETVKGTIQMEGNLTQASFPKLSEVDGGVNIDSSNVFNCSSFDKAHKEGDFHGDKYVCKGLSTTVSTTLASTSVNTAGGSSTGSSGADATNTASGSSSSSSQGTKNLAAAAPKAAAGTGIVGAVLTAVFALL